MDAFAELRDRSATIGPPFDYLALAPAAAAICYPFLLGAFHAVVGTQAATPSPLTIVGATLILAVALVVPFFLRSRSLAGATLVQGRGGSPMPAWRPQRSMSFLASFRP
jgi:hypothetical protein